MMFQFFSFKQPLLKGNRIKTFRLNPYNRATNVNQPLEFLIFISSIYYLNILVLLNCFSDYHVLRVGVCRQ